MPSTSVGTNTGSCTLLRNLLTVLERRVNIGNECLVTVRIVAKELSEKFPEDKKHLPKMISLTLEKIGVQQWGLATTKYRNMKWGVRKYAARIYQIDTGTVDNLRSYMATRTDSDLSSPDVEKRSEIEGGER